MLARTVTLLLAFVLFWSGSMTREQAASPAHVAAAGQLDAQMAVELPQCDASGAFDHDPEDRSEQAQAEAGGDLPALVQRLAGARFTVATLRPPPHRMAAWLTPTLDGLRRPPRGLFASA